MRSKEKKRRKRMGKVVIAWNVEFANMNMMGYSALYAHKFNTNFWHNVSNPEEFGFASQFLSLFPNKLNVELIL